MKLEDARQAGYDASGTLSTIVRQLALAGVGTVWILKPEPVKGAVVTGLQLNGFLLTSLIMFAIAVMMDAFQYSWSYYAWTNFSSHNATIGKKEHDDIEPMDWLQQPLHFFFYGKTVVCILGYVPIVIYLIKQVNCP